MQEITKPAEKSPQKVTIVGTGQVGMACAYSILQQGTCSELCLVDVVANKVKEYSCTAHSRLCIVTAGLRQKEGETRLSLVQRNTDIYKKIIPELVKYSPETLIMVVSNPVDVLTYVTWKLSGLPRERVFGSGTNLDSARQASDTEGSASSCRRSSTLHPLLVMDGLSENMAILVVMPVWSGVNVAGVGLTEVSKTLSTKLSIESWEADLHRQVVDSAYEIIKKKGYTCWGIGLSVAKIAKGIMNNARNVYALSTNVKGMHGITDDVYLSLPCVLGMNGVTHIIKQNLSQDEVEKLHKSWKTLFEVQNQIKL
ncbi:lactate/malate dehydrogenase, NAD binding domain protein [Ancylostoma caninum]|uniref:Lactate/malate dehydrogenase, NAD binding domain protein n=2 Tax=Ancylostoma TaxID=29169 RepID=A0A368GD55_ANCCA|nr:lactate/malate dehydrogenase, NAD binding domain protein [Ancylostoma caninum]